MQSSDNYFAIRIRLVGKFHCIHECAYVRASVCVCVRMRFAFGCVNLEIHTTKLDRGFDRVRPSHLIHFRCHVRSAQYAVLVMWNGDGDEGRGLSTTCPQLCALVPHAAACCRVPLLAFDLALKFNAQLIAS